MSRGIENSENDKEDVHDSHSDRARRAAERSEALLNEARQVQADLDAMASPEPRDKVTAFVDIGKRAEAAWEEARKAEAEAAAAARTRAQAAGLPEKAGLDEEARRAREFAQRARAAANEAAALRKRANQDWDATIAAELALKMAKFFAAHKDQIYERLEECDEVAAKAAPNHDLIFIAEGLPIVNSFIRVGSSRAALKASTDWVEGFWPDTDASVVLSALVFTWIANQGVKDFEHDPDKKKRETWNRIRGRLERLFD